MDIRRWSVELDRGSVNDSADIFGKILYDKSVVGYLLKKDITAYSKSNKDTFRCDLPELYKSALLYDTKSRDIRYSIDYLIQQEIGRYKSMYDDFLKLK